MRPSCGAHARISWRSLTELAQHATRANVLKRKNFRSHSTERSKRPSTAKNCPICKRRLACSASSQFWGRGRARRAAGDEGQVPVEGRLDQADRVGDQPPRHGQAEAPPTAV